MGRKVTLSQYAAHRGCSNGAITHALKAGRISVELDPATGRRVIDVEAADAQWTQNTRHDHRRNGMGSQPVDQVELGAPAETDPAPVDMQALEELLDADKAPSITSSRQVREAYLARTAKLDYEERAGKLVPAEDVQKEWVSIATITRNKVLGIPSKARQRIPELTLEAHGVLEAIVREALEELSSE